MTSISLAEKAGIYLQRLCIEIPNRRVGSTGNRAATDFFSDTATAFGFETDSPIFDCMDWSQEGAQLTVNATPFEAFVSPYSLGCHVRALLVVTSTVEELEAAEVTHAMILLRGDLAREPFAYPMIWLLAKLINEELVIDMDDEQEKSPLFLEINKWFEKRHQQAQQWQKKGQDIRKYLKIL